MENEKVHYLTAPSPEFREKEQLYLDTRRRERRLLTDAETRVLPHVAEPGPLAREWRWRRRSFARFMAYCWKKSAVANRESAPFRILDLGCGNGWMANRMAENAGWDVWAADLNETELVQGARLFGRANLRFVYADALAGALPARYFDLVVLAASAQYFPNLKELVGALRVCLKTGGEIHIFDTPFYTDDHAQAAARSRSAAYYAGIGVPEMAGRYHHHLRREILALGAEDRNTRPLAIILQKIKWLPPFSWYVLSA